MMYMSTERTPLGTKRGNLLYFQLRMPPEMMEALEAVTRRRRMESGDNVTRAAVIREFLAQGLKDESRKQWTEDSTLADRT